MEPSCCPRLTFRQRACGEGRLPVPRHLLCASAPSTLPHLRPAVPAQPGPCCSPPSPLALDPTRASQWPLQDPVWGRRLGGAATQGWECTDLLPKTLGSPSAAFTPNVLAPHPPQACPVSSFCSTASRTVNGDSSRASPVAAASLTSPTAPAQGLVHRPLPSPPPCTQPAPGRRWVGRACEERCCRQGGLSVQVSQRLLVLGLR